MFKAELREALAETLGSIKTKLLAFKTELSSSMSAVRQDVASLRGTVAEVELSLSTCTDDILALQAKVEQLTPLFPRSTTCYETRWSQVWYPLSCTASHYLWWSTARLHFPRGGQDFIY